MKGFETPPYSLVRLASYKCVQRLLLAGEIWSLHSKLRPICFQRMQHCWGFKCTTVLECMHWLENKSEYEDSLSTTGPAKAETLGYAARRVSLVLDVGYRHCSSSPLLKESASSAALCQVFRSSEHPWKLIAPCPLLCYISNGAWLHITVKGCDFSGWNIISRNSSTHKSNSHVSENQVPFIYFNYMIIFLNILMRPYMSCIC